MTTSPFDSDRGPDFPRRKRGGGGGGKRRGDPNAMVPDAEFTSYYGRQIVKPAPWDEKIPAYFFLGGVAAGSGLIGAWADVKGLDRLRRNSRISAIAAVGGSTVALIGDLGRPERALNMLRTVKLTSPMSIGTWIFSAFSASAGVAAAAEGSRMLGLTRGQSKPRRLLRRLLGVAEPLSNVGSAAFAAPLAAYTAVLVSATATPLWHESYRELPFVFTSSALAAASGLALITTPTDETRHVRRLAVAGAAADTAAFHLMTHRLGVLAEPLEQGRPGRLAKAATALTVAGGIGAALFGRSRVGAALSGAALMAGSAATRFAVVEAGIESAKDPKYTVLSQRNRLAARRAAGQYDDAVITVPRRSDVTARGESHGAGTGDRSTTD